MSKKEFFRLIRAGVFFKQYCPEVTNFYNKLRGFDGNNKPMDFTPADKIKIKAAANKLGKQFNKLEL